MFRIFLTVPKILLKNHAILTLRLELREKKILQFRRADKQ